VRAQELLDTLQAQGVQVEANGDRLRLRGRQSVLTPALQEELRAHKTEVLALLDESASTQLAQLAQPVQASLPLEQVEQVEQVAEAKTCPTGQEPRTNAAKQRQLADIKNRKKATCSTRSSSAPHEHVEHVEHVAMCQVRAVAVTYSTQPLPALTAEREPSRGPPVDPHWHDCHYFLAQRVPRGYTVKKDKKTPKKTKEHKNGHSNTGSGDTADGGGDPAAAGAAGGSGAGPGDERAAAVSR
jgi:hypothetical protein